MTDATQDDGSQKLAAEVVALTPLAIMLEGYQAAARAQTSGTLVAQHLHEAALAHARSLRALNHQAAALWLEPTPIGPIGMVTKVAQMQALMLQHLTETVQDGAVRFARLTAAQENAAK